MRLAGRFELANAPAVVQELDRTESQVKGCQSLELNLAQTEEMDGTGAVLVARFLDRVDSTGCRTSILEGHNCEAARLIGLYRRRKEHYPAPEARATGALGRLGEAASHLPGMANQVFCFSGRCAAAVPQVAAKPNSVDWPSLPRLIQEIGANALSVASAANLLVGIIIAFVGLSQLARFGAVAMIPELVVVAHLRELGPLVTAIVIAGRTGAGLASELATMSVSEETDVLRAMGYDPVKWLVVPRCLALVITVPLLTWIGDFTGLVGGFAATTLLSHITPRAYVLATMDAITASSLLTGLSKTPFLGLAIGLIACGQGLLAKGGAAAVGARTTVAVVQAIFGVIVISALFTLFFALLGV